MDQPPVQPFWSSPTADLLAQLGTSPQGLSPDEARATPGAGGRQSPQAQETHRLPHPAAGAIQEPHHPHPALRRRAFLLPGRPRRRPHHPGHRAGERPAGLLAGAGRHRRRGEAAGHRPDQGHGAARRRAQGNPGGGGGARRRGGPRRRGRHPRRLPDPGVQGPVRGRGDPHRRDLPGGESGRGPGGRHAALAKRTNTLFMGTHVVSGTATAVVVQTGKAHRVRQGLGAAEAPAAGDRVRARGQAASATS